MLIWVNEDTVPLCRAHVNDIYTGQPSAFYITPLLFSMSVETLYTISSLQ